MKQRKMEQHFPCMILFLLHSNSWGSMQLALVIWVNVMWQLSLYVKKHLWPLHYQEAFSATTVLSSQSPPSQLSLHTLFLLSLFVIVKIHYSRGHRISYLALKQHMVTVEIYYLVQGRMEKSLVTEIDQCRELENVNNIHTSSHCWDCGVLSNKSFKSIHYYNHWSGILS